MTALATAPAEPLPGPPCYTEIDSPVGSLILVGDGTHLTGLYLGPTHRWAPPVGPDWRRADAPFARAAGELAEYFAGRRRTFELPVALRGTPFQRRVWAVLATLPYGTTTSYGEIAARLGTPHAARAVGLANGRNPVSIVLPCHRVVGSDGGLTGYGGGLDRKRWLLEMERGGTLPLEIHGVAGT